MRGTTSSCISSIIGAGRATSSRSCRGLTSIYGAPRRRARRFSGKPIRRGLINYESRHGGRFLKCRRWASLPSTYPPHASSPRRAAEHYYAGAAEADQQVRLGISCRLAMAADLVVEIGVDHEALIGMRPPEQPELEQRQHLKDHRMG